MNAFMIISHRKELTNIIESPAFLIDNEKIKKEDMLFIVYKELSLEEKAFMGNLGLRYILIPQDWNKFCREYPIENFISHAEYDKSAIKRNRILNKHGIKTWFYAHSQNSINQFDVTKKTIILKNLYYDYLIAWNKPMIWHYKKNATFKECFNVGCLWSERIKKMKPDKNTIAFFDTNVWKPYIDEDDLFNFYKDIQKLMIETEMEIIIKEKKPRDWLSLPLQEFLKRMENYSRCHYATSTEVIAQSGITISLPYTSPTFEALCARKKAFWYDPLGKTYGTPYAKIYGLVAHNYRELRQRIDEFLPMSDREYNNYLDRHIKYNLEDYLDKKAITRFRELL